jgi:hypothetical protein
VVAGGAGTTLEEAEEDRDEEREMADCTDCLSWRMAGSAKTSPKASEGSVCARAIRLIMVVLGFSASSVPQVSRSSPPATAALLARLFKDHE